jgi:hypothetical protein
MPLIKAAFCLCTEQKFVRKGLMRSLFTVLKLEQIRRSLKKQISLRRILSFIATTKTLGFSCEMLDASESQKSGHKLRNVGKMPKCLKIWPSLH